jgi:hypothetical protein
MFERSLHCPFCGRHTATEPAQITGLVHPRNGPQWYPVQLPYEGAYVHRGVTGNDLWYIAQCHGCGRCMLINHESGEMFPTPRPAPSAEELPEQVRVALEEGKRCLTVAAWNAAVTMVRRALEVATHEKGAPDNLRNLQAKIQWLEQQGLIVRSQREACDAVRWFGNDGAHAVEGVGKEEAEAIVDLAELLFEAIYVIQVRAGRVLQRR